MKKTHRNLLLILCTLLITGCDDNKNSISDTSTSGNSNTSSPIVEDDSKDILFAENYGNLKNLQDVEAMPSESLMYDDDLFGAFPNRKYQELYLNNKLDNTLKDGRVTENDDAKYVYYNDDTMRFVNRSDGYAINLKTDTTYNADFSIAAYRSKLYNKETTLTISKETKNPYTGSSAWKIYRDDWLIRYINNPEYLADNDLVYSEDVIFESLDILENYSVSIFSIEIKNPGNIRKMFYNIGIVREFMDVKGSEFYLFVMKSDHNRNDDFKNMLKSFQIIESKGKSQNHMNNLELRKNPNWSEETAAYYDKLVTQQRTDWGIYTRGIEDNVIVKNKLEELSTAMDYDFDILPTYLHIASNNTKHYFAADKAKSLAGGNGFNGKMVLQLSYQYTNNNNNVTAANKTDCYTPMFDILRGPLGYDDFFAMRNRIYEVFDNLANGLKSYQQPVLFRLNNEMNTDWTSYCGMMTLIDPDIFQATWRCLYLYLQERGVNNTIWIFNPVADSCPFSAWGEDLCYYPGLDFAQVLGLTYYEDNNSNTVNLETFRKDYTKLYNKNNPVWNKYPWIISEFGCGSGGSASGEIYRNQPSQTDYVTGMFEDFNHRDENPYLQNIKGAVWFSCNDYNKNLVSNQYELVIEKLPMTIAAFKEGLKNNKQ